MKFKPLILNLYIMFIYYMFGTKIAIEFHIVMKQFNRLGRYILYASLYPRSEEEVGLVFLDLTIRGFVIRGFVYLQPIEVKFRIGTYLATRLVCKTLRGYLSDAILNPIQCIVHTYKASFENVLLLIIYSICRGCTMCYHQGNMKQFRLCALPHAGRKSSGIRSGLSATRTCVNTVR